MATLKILPMKLDTGYSHQHGYQGTEAANQTFKVGNLISPDANGAYQATPAGAAATTAKNRIATAPGQNLAAPTRKAEFVHPREAGWIEASASGAAASAALIKPGAEYGYAVDGTTGLGYVNLADTTNKVFRVESSELRKGAYSDTGVRILVTLLPTTY